MFGVVMTGNGGFECLEWREDLPMPQAGPGDVLIKVGAAGVNNTDINTRIGWYSKGGSGDDAAWTGKALEFPRVQGADVCGRIVAVGTGVDAGRIGDRVIVEPCFQYYDGAALAAAWYMGSECDGGFAEFVRVPARYAHKVDCGLSDAELASFPCSYSTAENMLTRANVTAGDRVLVTGASGGVGSATVQLAQVRGAEVLAVTSAAKADLLIDLGASQTIARDADLIQALGRNAVDVVVDLVAGPSWPALLEVLRPKGRYATAGAIAGHTVSLDVRTLYLKDLSLFGATVLDEGVFARLVEHIVAGRIKPLVAETYPLRQIQQAQEAFLQKAHVGKIVLTHG